MFSLYYIIALITCLYACMIAVYAIGWRKQQPCTEVEVSDKYKVSVIVAIRNEAKHLPTLLTQLQQQTYTHFEAILLNDHSTDESKAVFDSFCDARFLWIEANDYGKKAAIRQAVTIASGSLLLTTDADVTLPPTWIESMLKAFEQCRADLLIGPVTMHSGTVFEKLDYWSLEGTTIGSAAVGWPVLCSGANLAFTAQWYQKCVSYLHFDVPSGDDMFLLEATRKLKGRVCAFKDKQATVLIKGCSSLSSFFRQRARWAGKAPHYTDTGICFSAALVAIMQIVSIVAMVMLWWQPYFLFPIVAKCLVDSLLVGQVARYHHQMPLMWAFPLMSLLYPVYVLIVLVLTLFPIQWKERTL